MYTKAGKPMHSKTVRNSGDLLRAHSLLRKKNPVNVSLTINYDYNTYNLLRIIRWKIVKRRQIDPFAILISYVINYFHETIHVHPFLYYTEKFGKIKYIYFMQLRSNPNFLQGDC